MEHLVIINPKDGAFASYLSQKFIQSNMKAKVKLTDMYSGRNLVLVCALVEYSRNPGSYGFSFETLSDFQHNKIESYFGKLNAYSTHVDIIKIL